LAGNVIEAEGGINAGMQDRTRISLYVFISTLTRENFIISTERMALKWIQKYITLFGGDPEKVTL
jgi:hypothetical protein